MNCIQYETAFIIEIEVLKVIRIKEEILTDLKDFNLLELEVLIDIRDLLLFLVENGKNE